MHIHLRTATVISVISVALTSLLTACGGSNGEAGGGTNAAATAFTYTGSDRDTYLADCAKKEGSVTWYTSLAGGVIDDMIKAFNEKYPDVKVKTFRGDESDITSRVVQESQADRLQGDILELSSDAYRELADIGALATFTSPVTAKYSERFTLKNDEGKILGIGDRASYVSFAYNTNKVPEADVPKTLDDLLKPALKGKLALTDSTTGVRFIGNVLTTLGEDAGKAYLKKLGEQNIRIESVSGSALAGLIAKGEVASSPGIFRNHAQQLIKDNSPIKWVAIEPVTANVGYAGVFAKAPHPCAAMLLTDMLLSEDGGKIYEKKQYPRPDEDLGFRSWVPDETYKTAKDYEKAFTTWQELFEKTFS